VDIKVLVAVDWVDDEEVDRDSEELATDEEDGEYEANSVSG
jgi:hypothetical protein